MTRKDYVKFAEMFASLDDGQQTSVTVSGTIGREGMLDLIVFRTADILASDNPRFDRDQFFAACESK